MTAPGLRVRESVVRRGALVATVRGEEAAPRGAGARLVLTVNGQIVAEAEPPAPGQEATLRAPLPVPDVVLEEISVALLDDGVLTPLAGDAAHHLPRLVVTTTEQFIDSVQRKGFRIADDETLVEAARRSMLRFVGQISTLAVAACVIGYRYVDYPDWADAAALDLLAAQSDALRASIDETVFEEARWAPTIDVMLYQVFAVHGQHQRAIHYLCRLYADRPLVHIEPMCAFNLSLGVLVLGYLYFLQGRMKEAIGIWAAYEDVFVTAAVKQPKRLGTIREFGFIHKNSVLAVAGMVQAKARNPAQRSSMMTEERIAAQAVRSTAPEALRRIRAFFTAARAGEVTLPPGKTVVSSRPDRWY
jgi:hypothetical protein